MPNSENTSFHKFSKLKIMPSEIEVALPNHFCGETEFGIWSSNTALSEVEVILEMQIWQIWQIYLCYFFQGGAFVVLCTDRNGNREHWSVL